jgi:hypothetical protein
VVDAVFGEYLTLADYVVDGMLIRYRGLHLLLARCLCLEAGCCIIGIYAGSGSYHLNITSFGRVGEGCCNTRARQSLRTCTMICT